MSVRVPSEDFSFCPKCGGGLELRLLKELEPERLVCTACEFVFFQNPKLAAGAIFQHEGGLVLLRRAIEPGYGKWVFPGGFVDRGETVVEAARRETREEANVEVKLLDLVDVYSYAGAPVVVVVYAAEWISGELRAADESLEVGVFDPKEIPWPDLAFPSTRDAVKSYIRRYHCSRRKSS